MFLSNVHRLPFFSLYPSVYDMWDAFMLILLLAIDLYVPQFRRRHKNSRSKKPRTREMRKCLAKKELSGKG